MSCGGGSKEPEVVNPNEVTNHHLSYVYHKVAELLDRDFGDSLKVREEALELTKETKEFLGLDALTPDDEKIMPRIVLMSNAQEYVVAAIHKLNELGYAVTKVKHDSSS